MATYSDDVVLDRILQIQTEGGGDNPATRAQIAQEAIAAGVGADQIGRALNLAVSRGISESPADYYTGGTRVSNIASGLGYDLGAPSPLVDLETVGDLQAAQEGLYRGDFGMPGYETIMQRLYAPTLQDVQSGTVTAQEDVVEPSPFLIGSGVGQRLGSDITTTLDPDYTAPESGFMYDSPTELAGKTTGELIAQNVAQGPLTQSMEQIITPSAVEGEAPTVSYEYVPFDPTTSQPIVTALPEVKASDFLFSGSLRQPELGPVVNTFGNNLQDIMANAVANDPLARIPGDLNGDGVVDASERAAMESGTPLYNQGGYVSHFANGGYADYESEAYGVGGAEVSEPTASYSISGADGNQIEVVDYSRDYSGPRLADGTPDPYGTGQGLNRSTDRIDYRDDPNQVLRDLQTFEGRRMAAMFDRFMGPTEQPETFETYMDRFNREQMQTGNPNPVARFAQAAEKALSPMELGSGEIQFGKTPQGGYGATYTQDLYPGDIVKGIGSLFRSMTGQ